MFPTLCILTRYLSLLYQFDMKQNFTIIVLSTSVIMKSYVVIYYYVFNNNEVLLHFF